MSRQTKPRRDAATAWLERSNPLQGLSISAAQSIFDCARNGDTQRLHWIYQEIESVNPTLLMCVARRAGSAANFGWRVSERAALDGALSSEQKDAVESFLSGIDNLGDLFEHLDLAFFRGFAHAQPVWDGNGVLHIELLDSWKFLKKDGEWFFNPVCDGFSSNCVSCRDARLITVERKRPVDVPALAIHIRHAIGNRDWGRFLERYALPKPAVVMAANATKENREEYLEGASALENGQVTVWPNGSSLMDFAGGSRGVDPFSSFVEHQEKTIVMLATGGTLGSIAESGAGTLAGNAQADVWQGIVARDSRVIAQAIQRSLVVPFIEAAFPGKPVVVDFEFDLTQKPTPKEIFEIAAAAKTAGYIIDKAQLEEETGYRLEKDVGTQDTGHGTEGNFGGFLPNSAPAAGHSSKTAFKTHEKAFKIASSDSDGQGEVSGEDALVEALSGLFEKSLAEAAAEAVEGEVENANPDQPRGQPDNAGQFATTGGASGASTDKPTVEARNDGKIDFKGNTRAKAQADSQARTLGYYGIDDLMQQSATVPQERIDAIVAGGDRPCKPHEAIAALRSHATIRPNVKGEEPVKLTERPIRHYVCGERRRNGEPDVSRLESLPTAIKAIRECDSYHHTLDGNSVIRMPGEKLPQGAQTVYERRSGQGRSTAFAYTDSGVLNGWQLN